MIPGDFAIRVATAVDLDAIFLIEQQAITGAHWPRATYEAITAAGKDSQPRRAILVFERADEVLGFCVVSAISTESELENIAVVPNARGSGIGRALLRNACAWASEQHAKQMNIEVRESNTAALALYLAAGFQQTARRPGHYGAPPEAALVLTLHI